MSDVVIAGVGMHPWGKWGRNFVEYGLHAARAALDDAGVDWRDVQYVVGGDTVRNGYPGYVAGATMAQALGWTGRAASCYAACATGAMAIDLARSRILAGQCDVALVVGADTTPKGFLAPNAGERPTTRTGCGSAWPASPTPPTSRCGRAVAWSCTGPARPTSPRSRPRTPGTA
jgi:acetyl-CoA acetyltransferase